MACVEGICGTGIGLQPLPGDPGNNSILTATPAFGGIDVAWTYPTLNPYAIAYTRLFRGLSADFVGAALYIEAVPGSFFYDKVDANTTYYYWIQSVSINGTAGDVIGPASATARPTIDQIITQLTGKIDAGTLAQSLKTDIDRITLLDGDLTQEKADRMLADDTLSATVTAVQNDLANAQVLLNQEIQLRSDNDSVLVTKIDALVVKSDSNAAAIATEETARIDAVSAEAGKRELLSSKMFGVVDPTTLTLDALTTGLLYEEKTARTTQDSALSQSISALQAKTDTNAAAVQDLILAKIGYSALSGSLSPYDGDGVTIVYPVATYPDATYPQYANSRARIIDKVGVTNWNATAAGAAKPLVWVQGLPLASGVQTYQVVDANGGTASVQQAFVAQKSLNDDFKAMYTAKVSVIGSDGTKLIGGFGLYGDPTGIEAGFDVDTFWIGRTGPDKKKPFIVDSGTGEVFIDDAVIQKLTFDKLRAADGSFIVANGKVQANYLQVNNAQSSNYVAGTQGWAINANGSAEFRNIVARGDIQATSLNAATGTFSGTLTANAVNAVNTINVAGNAITVPAGSVSGNFSVNQGAWSVQICTLVHDSRGAQVAIHFTCPDVVAGQFGIGSARIYRDGVVIVEKPFIESLLAYVDAPNGAVTYTAAINRPYSNGSHPGGTLTVVGYRK